MGRVVRLDGDLYVRWYDARGRRRHKRIRGSEAEARAIARDLEIKVARERLGLVEAGPAEEKPLADLVRAWRDHLTLSQRRPSTWELYKLGLDEVFRWLRRRGNPLDWASDIRREDVAEYAAEKLKQPASPRTVNMRIGAVRGLLNWSVEQGYIRDNPLAKWKPLKHETPGRRRTLEKWEIAALLEKSPREDGDFWRFILGTGLRAGELAALEWPDVDWVERQILVRAEVSKSRRERWIPLRADLLPILQRQARQKAKRKAKASARVAGAEATLARAGDDAERAAAAKRLEKALRTQKEAERLVFGNSAGGQWDGHLSRRLKPCLRAAGLPEEIDLHTLRHTFASHLVRAGVDLKTVGDLLGHSSVAITAIYIHPFEERKAQAVELVPIPGGIEDRQTAGKPPVEAASG